MTKNKIQISSKCKITMFKTIRPIGDWKLRIVIYLFFVSWFFGISGICDCLLKIVIYPDKIIGSILGFGFSGLSGLGIGNVLYGVDMGLIDSMLTSNATKNLLFKK
ncbi:MAG: hypothetical protein ABIG69_06540 [Bacteroidota bacterium]